MAGRVLLATTALALVVSVAVAALVVPERWIEFAIAVGAYLIAGSASRFALTALQMQQRHMAYSLLESLRALLQLALPIASITVFPGSFFVVSIASSLAVLIAGIVAGNLASRRVVAGPSRFTQKEFFALGLPLIIMALFGFGLNNAERMFLKVYYDASAVAIFAAAYALARQPINIGAFPEVVSRFDEQGPAAAGQFLSQLMALMIRLCLPVAALLIALSDDMTRLLLPAAYHGHFGKLFPIIAFSVLCANLTSFVYGDVVHAHKKPWLLIIANGVGSVATITLSLLLIPSLAAVGAALALAGGSAASLVACIVISERLTHVPVPWRDIGLSIMIAAGTGLAASLMSAAAGALPVIFKLAGGGFAGGLVFLGLSAVFHPREARQIAAKLRSRLGSFGARF